MSLMLRSIHSLEVQLVLVLPGPRLDLPEDGRGLVQLPRRMRIRLLSTS